LVPRLKLAVLRSAHRPRMFLMVHLHGDISAPYGTMPCRSPQMEVRACPSQSVHADAPAAAAMVPASQSAQDEDPAVAAIFPGTQLPHS
jgi:hypothetical protein